MNKKMVIIVSGVVILLILIGVAGVNYKNIEKGFWNWVGNLNFEMPQTEQYGPIGIDTKFVLGDGKFQLLQTHGKNFVFIMKYNESLSELLLNECSKYKYVKSKKKLYVISNDEGYGVADGFTNRCKLYITVSPDEFISGYSIDDQGVKHEKSRFVNDEHIQYLSEYDDFTDEEKEIFEKMK